MTEIRGLYDDFDYLDSTTTQYNSAIGRYIEWGGLLPCDADMIIDFIIDMGNPRRVDRLTVASLRVYRSALKRWHEEARFEDPTADKEIDKTFKRLSSIERQNGIRKKSSRFITPEEGFQLITLLIVMSDTAKARRERLITTISLMSGHRTSMIAQVNVDDMMNLGVPDTNIIINTPAFKTDTEAPTYIPFTGGKFCPATWVREYITEHDITDGWLFKSSKSNRGHLARQTINDTTKRVLETANITGGKLTSTSFRKTMATLAAMRGVSAMAIAAQGSWTSIETINKSYVSKALALQGEAPLAVLESIKQADKALTLELGNEVPLLANKGMAEVSVLQGFEEMRQGYWDVIFHTDITIEAKRGFASYFRSADKYVVESGGESIMNNFNRTCSDSGYKKLIMAK
jgi:hypothetical protein